MDVLSRISLQEKGDADTFAELFADKLIFDHNDGSWYIFNGHVWEKDKCNHTYNLVERIAQLYEQAIEKLNLPHNEGVYRFYRARVNSLRKRAGINNTLSLAASKMPLKYRWDSNPYLLACKNGVIELKTGELREGKPDDYIKKFAHVEWKGLTEPCERWEQFLSELFPGNPEIPKFLQRLFGYAISGLSVEHVFAIFYGKRGRNGKDVMLETLCKVLGEDLSGTISKEVMLSGLKNPGAAAPFLFELKDKRLVYSDETNEGAAFDTAQIKMLSGGAPFVAKELYHQPITIYPQYLIVLTSNSRPVVDADDDALWERLIVIEYKQRFVDNPVYDNEHTQDKFLKQKLEAEYSGILAWLVKGFLEWQTNGLMIPKSVQYNTEEYRLDQDSLGRFIESECVIDTEEKVNVTRLYECYAKWADSDGAKKLSRKEFSRKIEERYLKERLAEGYCYYGIGLKPTVEETLNEYLLVLQNV